MVAKPLPVIAADHPPQRRSADVLADRVQLVGGVVPLPGSMLEVGPSSIQASWS
jgi:hypothetical protein